MCQPTPSTGRTQGGGGWPTCISASQSRRDGRCSRTQEISCEGHETQDVLQLVLRQWKLTSPSRRQEIRFSSSFEGCLGRCWGSSGWCGDSEGAKSHLEREDRPEGWQVRKAGLSHGFCKTSPQGRYSACTQLTDEKTKSPPSPSKRSCLQKKRTEQARDS